MSSSFTACCALEKEKLQRSTRDKMYFILIACCTMLVYLQTINTGEIAKMESPGNKKGLTDVSPIVLY
jgi:hypothetical protein